MSKSTDHIAVVGAGAWGIALANVIARAGRAVLLATRDGAGAEVLVNRRESPRLPGVRLDERVGVAPAGVAVGQYDAILLAVPSQRLREAAQVIAPSLRKGTLSGKSGQIVQHTPEAMTIRTPAGIMGVRGTDFLMRADSR